MDFSVHTQQDTHNYSGNAKYKVDPSGVLITDDGDGRRVIYGVGAWSQLKTATPPGGRLLT